MTDRVSQTSIFVAGAARFSDLIYLIARDRGLVTRNVEHSRFIAFDQGEFGHMADRNWNAVGICVVKHPTEKMLAVGENGEVFTYAGGDSSDETITPKPSVLRGIGVVGGFAVACGMKRQVYKRVAEGAWTVMSAPAPRKGVNAGFEAITGFGADEIYAVGWAGEIWQWGGSQWIQHASPTNLILTGVCCGEDGAVYVCGQHGTLIRGRGATWERIELENVTTDFWDLRWFNGQLYIASIAGVYMLVGNSIVPVDFGADRAQTCGKLTDAQGVLWSVGSDDVFSFDGGAWARVD